MKNNKSRKQRHPAPTVVGEGDQSQRTATGGTLEMSTRKTAQSLSSVAPHSIEAFMGIPTRPGISSPDDVGAASKFVAEWKCSHDPTHPNYLCNVKKWVRRPTVNPGPLVAELGGDPYCDTCRAAADPDTLVAVVPKSVKAFAGVPGRPEITAYDLRKSSNFDADWNCLLDSTHPIYRCTVRKWVARASSEVGQVAAQQGRDPYCTACRVAAHPEWNRQAHASHDPLRVTHPHLVPDARLADPDKHAGCEVGDLTQGSDVMVIWPCHVPGHDAYPMTVANRIANKGCPECGKDKATATQRTPEPGNSLADLVPPVRDLFIENTSEPDRGPDRLKYKSNDKARFRCIRDGCDGYIGPVTVANWVSSFMLCEPCGYRQRAEKLRLDGEQCAERMRAALYDPLTPYPGADSHWPCIHTRCGRRLEKVRYSKISAGEGCCTFCQAQDASLRNRHTHEQAAAIAFDNHWTPLELYPGKNNIKWLCRHEVCGNTWRLTLSTMQRPSKADNCPHCSAPGRRWVEPAIIYFAESEDWGVIKLGWASLVKHRHGERIELHQPRDIERLRNFSNRIGFTFLRITTPFLTGAEAHKVEQRLLKIGKSAGWEPSGLRIGDFGYSDLKGESETFALSARDAAIELLDSETTIDWANKGHWQP